MSNQEDVTAASGPADEEVELTADDLRALSAPAASDSRKDSVAASAPAHAAAQKQSDSGEPVISRMTRPLGIAIALMAVAGGLHHSFKERTGHPSTPSAAGLAAREQWPLAPRGTDTVRFANPFDASEVFEFPAGTTEAEAREAVAGFLIERATNRQARLDGRSNRSR